MKPTVSRQWLLVVFASVSVLSLVIGNIVTCKQMDFFGLALTSGVFLIPFSYVVGDAITEIWGFGVAKRVIILSFALNAIAVAIFALTIVAPPFETFTMQSSIEDVLGTTPRIFGASLLAYIVGSFINARIMDAMHTRDGENKLALRCIASTIVGEFIDMTIFEFAAFAFILPADVILQIIILEGSIKILVECVLYVTVTKWVIKDIKQID